VKMKLLTYKLAALLVLAAFPFLFHSEARGQSLDAEESALLSSINQYRASRGLAQLTASPMLTAAAKWHSADMAARGVLSHVDSQGRAPAARMAAFGYTYQTALGENVAAGNSTASGTLSQWQGSPGHNSVLLYPDFRAVGIGRAAGGTWFWTADFGGFVDAAVTQTCTPPLFQGYPSSCSTINLRWLNQDPISLISHYEIFRSGQQVGTVPGSAISFSEAVGCNFAAVYTIRQVMKSGSSCQTVTSSNPPHTKPCDMCSGSGGGGGGAPGTIRVVSSASFDEPVSPGSLATIFPASGQSLTSTTATANTLPLPTSLAGAQVVINGNLAPLFYVSAGQVNFWMPDWASGSVQVAVTSASGAQSVGGIQLGANPAIFTANSSGSGVAAALVTVDGRTYQSVVGANGAAIPISVSVAGKPNYLILFGTGLRGQGAVQVSIGGRNCPVTWSGAHSRWVGLDQVNVQFVDSLRGAGSVPVVVTAGGVRANTVTITIGN
jgi:uncharacterized protein (TIGR03437 family)